MKWRRERTYDCRTSLATRAEKGRVEAGATAHAAVARMQEQGIRRGAWQLRALQARIAMAGGREAEANQAVALARQEIDFVAAHAGSDEARHSFLHLPEIVQIRGEI